MDVATDYLGIELEKAHEYIYSIDFSMIINVLIKKYKWFRVEAEQTCKQYRNYLWLLKKYGADHLLPPSEDIDEFWHHHILDSKKYIKDCEFIFGKYLHHYPYYGLDDKSTLTDLNDSFSETQKIYLKEFNIPIESTRYRFRTLLRVFLR